MVQQALDGAKKSTFEFLTWINDPIEEAFVKEAPAEMNTGQRMKYRIQLV